MAHDGTNHPWYQGFSNIFGTMNQGLQNAMMPQPQTTINPQEFYTDHFKNYYGELADNGMMNVQKVLSTNSQGEEFFDPNKLNEALKNNDFTTISEYLRASQKLTDKKLEPKGMVDRLSNNSTFIMGLQLMAAAGEGKSVQEALAPAMSTTQAFMTNQELRKQNKKLTMTRNGTIEERAMDLISKRAETTSAVTKADMDTITKDNWAESQRLKLEQAGVNLEISKMEKYFTFTTMGDKIKQTELNTKAMVKDLEMNELKMEEMNIMLETLPEMNQADLAIKIQQSENMDTQNKGMILENINKNIDNQVDSLNLKIMQNKEGINAEWRAWVGEQGYDAATKMAMLDQGPEAYFDMVDRVDINKHRDAYEAYSSSMGSSALKAIFSSTEALDSDKTLIKEQIISLAVKNAKGGKPTKAHFEAAEEIVFKDWNIRKNGYVKRLLGFPEYKMGVRSGNPNSGQAGQTIMIGGQEFVINEDGTASLKGMAMGGPVRAGQAYNVGEEGPEVFVPNQDGNIVSNPGTPGGYNWEDAIIDNSEMLSKIKKANGRNAAIKALKKFRPDLYV